MCASIVCLVVKNLTAHSYKYSLCFPLVILLGGENIRYLVAKHDEDGTLYLDP